MAAVVEVVVRPCPAFIGDRAAGGQLVVLGHNGLDPGVSAVVAHHLVASTTIVVLGNYDGGSWPVCLRLAADLG